MDVNQNSPIVIHSDDEDDDDDVVLVEDKTAENDGKKQEDDVIFISEEQPTLPGPKCAPENKKNKRKGAVRSNNSRAGVDDGCNIPRDGYFPSDFSSLSLMNDILRPLDLSHGSILTPGNFPAAFKHRLNLLKQLQNSCSSVTSPDQGGNNSSKADDDIEDDSVKVLHNFDMGSGTDAGNSGKLEIISPLKISERTDPLSSQTLSASVCKIYVEKSCFNLSLAEGKEMTTLASDIVNASSSSALACTDKPSFLKDRQDISANLCEGSTSQKNPQLKSIITSASSASLTQGAAASDLCDVRNLGFSSPATSAELAEALCSSVVSSLDCPENVNPDKSPGTTSASTNNNYLLSELHSKPGTSKQYSSLVNLPAPQHVLNASDSCVVADSKASSSSADSPLSLDFDNLTSEDFTTLLDFFSVIDKPQSPNDQPTGSSGLNGESSKSSSVIGSAADKQTSLSCSEAPSISGSSVTGAVHDHHYFINSNKRAGDNTSFQPSSSKFGSSLDYLDQVSQKSSVPEFGSPDGSSVIKLSSFGKKLYKSGIEKSGYLKSICHSSKNKDLRTKMRALVLRMRVSSKRSQSKYHLSLARGHRLKLSKVCSPRTLACNGGIISSTDHGKADAGHWQIVQSEPSQRRRKLLEDGPCDGLSDVKKKNLEGAVSEKPSLKIRLKLSPSVPCLESSIPPPYQPSSIGLKKSIMKRHSSMIGDISAADMKACSSIHRSISDGGSNQEEEEEEQKDPEMLCIICDKTINSRKLSRCNKGHGICATCLEPQVKAILKGDVKQKNINCLFSTCTEILSFGELKRTLPSFVVDILEEKLDKEYLSYITKWMFTDEQLKSRSEFATLDTRMSPSSAVGVKKCEEMFNPEFHDSAEDFPRFWLPMQPGSSVMAFEVIPDTEEYRALACQFHETLSFGDYDIVRIIRIQNPILWKYFSLKQSEMIQEDDGMGVAEKRLYHGTHRSTLEAIARKGFDWRLSGKHGTVYGNGSYFATTARYSHAYTDRAGSGISVKTGGSGVGSFFSSSTSLTYPGFGGSTLSQRLIHNCKTRFSNLPHSPMIPTIPLHLPGSSQNQPPQPPPAHYHFPAPPPAHGQTSSLQVPAHIQMSNPNSTKEGVPGMSASSSRASANNTPFVKILPKPSTVSVSAGPVQTVLNNYTGFFNSSSLFCPTTPLSQPHFPSSFQSRVTDPSFTSVSHSLSHTASSQVQLSVVSSGSFYTVPSMSKAGISPTISSPLSWRCALGNTSSSSQPKPITVTSSNAEAKYQDEDRSDMPSSPQGTADLASMFARDANSKTHFMFVARVLVGRHTVGKSGLKRPPPLNENDPFGKCYDSCVDDIYCPQLYVIFDSNQAYPEYVIEYNWHKD